jgi:hypothetical protein
LTARAEVVRIEAELAELAEARQRFEAVQRARLEQGLERAWDVAISAENRRAEELLRQKHAAELEQARQRLIAAQAAEHAAARALETAYAEQRAIERHREAFRQARLAERERAEDDQAVETWKRDRLGSVGR